MLVPEGDLPINCISSFKRTSLHLKPWKKAPIAFPYVPMLFRVVDTKPNFVPPAAPDFKNPEPA